jgi:ATP-dependent helicase HrpA
MSALERHQVIVVAGATGSGKTTQLPKIALEMGRGGRKRIGVTQPRRIAATSVAARVAKELDCQLGKEVGYQIRFEDRTSDETWVKFMTDGILLAEIQGDRLLREYDTLIVDEAHERSLTIDFILGWLKGILPKRPDLKVIISSATIETTRFSAFFADAPVIEVEGRTFPVEVLYEPPEDGLEWSDAVAEAVVNVTALDPEGDILVFLPGEREIREAEHALIAKNLRHTEILPLYARLSAADQAKVFGQIQKRRIILATNVAETSLTIPGIVYVIDTGIARLARYDARTGTTRLQIEPISRASADQRKGRCGRVRDGICIRLYEETDFASRPAFTDPEMKRTGLAGVILRMKFLGLGEVEDFPFLDPPHARSIAEGYRVLQELGALDEQRALTALGRLLARFPVDPRVARMIVAGDENDCSSEILVLASALNLQDPRERPRGQESKADQCHQRFRDERSDFSGLLKLFSYLEEQKKKGMSQLRRACKDGFLSFVRVREWFELHHQLEELVREVKRELPRVHPKSIPTERGEPPKKKPANTDGNALGERIHRALLSGLLSHVGQWNSEQRVYFGAKQTRFLLHPSSGLAKKPPAWVMTFELTQTSQLFARTNAAIEPEWLAEVGGHLLKRSYSDPHWSEKSARASVREHATLFGLSVLKDRSVDYSTIAKERARSMFIEHALVRGEYRSKGTFQQKNRALLDEIAKLRDKARVSDFLQDESLMYAFFDRIVPPEVVNGKTFEAFRIEAEATQPNLLVLGHNDVLNTDERIDPSRYPEFLEHQGVKLEARYRFDPSAEDDGVTLSVPLPLLTQLDGTELDWGLPAWLDRKTEALLNELPRTYRRELPDPSELTRRVCKILKPGSGPFRTTLVDTVYQLTHVRIPEDELRLDAIAPYLNFNLELHGERGKVVAASRNLEVLVERFTPMAREMLRAAATAPEFSRTGLTRWDIGTLPAMVMRRVGDLEIPAYPALLDRLTHVDLALLESREAAARAHRDGVLRLVQLQLRSTLTNLTSRAPAPFARRLGERFTPAQLASFREELVALALEDAFTLPSVDALPRSASEFEALMARGTPKLNNAFATVLRTVQTVGVELDRTLRAIDETSKHPSGTQALADVRAQLERLFPERLLSTVPLARLGQYPRYLRAIQVRLSRALVDPRKDAAKFEPLAPLLREYATRKGTAQSRPSLDRIRWAMEELRVALFAPELKAATGTSVEAVAAALVALRREYS